VANSYEQTTWPWIEGSHGMRIQLLDTLSDVDLSYSPGGKTVTLGELCLQMGNDQYSYVQSLKTFSQDWSYRNTTVHLENSVAQLKEWYIALDAEMKSIVADFTEADLKKSIDRSGGFVIPVTVQLDIYLQALLIFFGKASVYLKSMDRTLPAGMEDWIG